MKYPLIILFFAACQHPALEVQKVDTVKTKTYAAKPNGDYISKTDFNTKVADLQGQITKLNSAITLLQTQMKGKSDTTTFYFRHGEGGFSGTGKYYDELRLYDGQ